MVKVSAKKIAYRFYLLKKAMTINNLDFKETIISSHYEEKHSSYMNDEKILTLVKQLD